MQNGIRQEQGQIVAFIKMGKDNMTFKRKIDTSTQWILSHKIYSILGYIIPETPYFFFCFSPPPPPYTHFTVAHFFDHLRKKIQIYEFLLLSE